MSKVIRISQDTYDQLLRSKGGRDSWDKAVRLALGLKPILVFPKIEPLPPIVFYSDIELPNEVKTALPVYEKDDDLCQLFERTTQQKLNEAFAMMGED